MNEQEAQDVGADRLERQNGIEQTLDAVITITRRNWLTCEGALALTDGTAVNRTRIGRLSPSRILDAKHGRY